MGVLSKLGQALGIKDDEKRTDNAASNEAASSASNTATQMAKSSSNSGSTDAAMDRGTQVGKDLFKEYFGDSAQYKAGLQESLDVAKERANKGMNSADMAPVTGQYQQNQRALRAATGSSGMGKGGFAANAKMSQDRAYNVALANKNIDVMTENRANLDKMYAQRATAGMSIPMLMGSQYASAEASKIALQNQAQAGQMQADSGGKIICTELFRQGKMDKEIFAADNEFGLMMQDQQPEIHAGYIRWAKYVVPAMRKSPLVTKLVSLVALPWAKHMAFIMGVSKKDSLIGKLVMMIGLPICKILGKAKKEVIYG